MKKHLMIFVLLMVTGLLAMGQTVQITGMVTSSEDGLPLPGVTVKVQGLTIGTSTVIDGTYSLQVPRNATSLEFSFIGMQTLVVPIEGRTRINVTLVPELVAMDEVVVIAYGTAKKGSYTGSAAQIDSKKIESRPVTNFTKAIEGTNPGIQVTSASGQPGSGQDIRIRGFGSVSASNDPLYVVDGVPYSGSINSINSNDIESISILKDAASSALYGNRAANGVVLITTKRGSKDRTSMQLTVTQGISTRSIPEYERVSALEYYPLMWQSDYNRQIFAATPVAPATAAQNATNNLITRVGYNITTLADNQIVGTDGQLNPSAQIKGDYAGDLDWQEPLMRTGNRGEYNLTFNGGADKSDYYVSLGYLDEKGYVIKSDFKRYTGRINVNTTPKSWLRTGLNLSGAMTNSNTAVSGGSSYVNPFFFTRAMGPIYPVYAHDPATGAYLIDEVTGEYIYDLGNLAGLPTRVSGGSPGRHVIAETLWNDDLFKRNVLGARTYFDILFLKDFKFTMNVSADVNAYNYAGFENKIVGDGAPAGRGERVNSLTTGYTVNQLLNYSKTFDIHSVEVLLGHENFDYTYNYFRGFRQGQIVDGNTELVNFTTTNSLTSYTDKYRTEGFFTRVNYNFNEKYFFSGSFRRDASSKFFKDNRWGNFWSVSAAWRLDAEDFIKSQTWIDMAKLRASYGAVGNDNGIGYYAWQALYDIGANNAFEPGMHQSTLSNEALTWESNNAFDVALEFAVLKRITGSVEFYHRISSNLLFAVPLPSSSGLTSLDQNVGSMFNQGIELRLGIDVLKGSDFNWNIDINASTVKNEITKLPQEEIISGTKKLMVGHSIYDFWLRDWYGVDPTDGVTLYDANVKDFATQASNLRIINETDTVSTSHNNAKYHYEGSAIPDLMGGFTNTFSYKGFDLSILSTFQIGGKIYDGSYASLMHSGDYGRASHIDILNRWQKPGDITDVPRLDNSQLTAFDAQSDRFLIDASFFSIKAVTLSYTLPVSLTQRAGMKGARVWVSGENLLLMNARKGLDPQRSFAGTTDNVYTPSRILTVGVNISL
ncbi:MAG: TonB-dependent receptor [Bacteroidales bacterium]|nr:TonB-dependent receptor [Bacteroidales bacterium]